jgi:hypothetical protein
MNDAKTTLKLLEGIAEDDPALLALLIKGAENIEFPDPDRERAYEAENATLACRGGPIEDEFPGMDVLEDIDPEHADDLIAAHELLWEMVTDYVKEIHESATWRALLPDEFDFGLEVKRSADANSRGNVTGIEIACGHGPHRLVLCHEMAHVLNARLCRARLLTVGVENMGAPPYGHGAEWAGLFIALVRGMLGEVAADCLTAEFWKHGVPVTPDPWPGVRTHGERKEAA